MIYLAVFLIGVGLLFVGWCLFGLLLMPVFREGMVTICFERASGRSMEQKVRAFGWLRSQQGGILLIVDCGLTKEGLELAQLLCRDHDWVAYCPAQALGDYLSLLQDTI